MGVATAPSTVVRTVQTLKLTKNGRRKSRKRFRKGKAEGRLQICQSRTPVSRWEDPPSPEEPQFRHRSCWSHRWRLQLGHPQVSHREEGRGHQILDISKSIVSEGSRGGVLIEYGDIAILYSPPDSFLDYSCVFV